MTIIISLVTIDIKAHDWQLICLQSSKVEIYQQTFHYGEALRSIAKVASPSNVIRPAFTLIYDAMCSVCD